ncbi:hypothetical protein GGH94_003070 [Coemansia aciculifera]|uniref:Uncharacterized protein n=1 Tax=Coemansia aciculifera TaxID=417176 RepID=A0A9W8III1_9FUNG|nr:hypothetical protein GGH94_003070 [Coemansia aciculifera]
MNGTHLGPREAELPSPTDDQYDRGQVSIVATLCDHTTCATTTRSRSKWSRTRRSTHTTSSSSSSSQPISTPQLLSPLYNPTDQLFGQMQASSSSSTSTHDYDNIDDSGSTSRAIPSAIAVVVFLVIVALVYKCVRKRRKKKRLQEGALRLNSEVSGGSSLPATPSSLSGAGGIYLGQSHSSQSSVSLAQSRLQSPMTPHSLVNGTPAEMRQIRSTLTQHSMSSLGTDDSQLTVPMAAAVTRHRPPPPPPPPPPPLPASPPRVPPPLPPRMFPRERADTFSDIPHDDLPPYVDPIEEAMSANSEAEASTTPAPSHQPCPPPYHIVEMPEPPETRR